MESPKEMEEGVEGDGTRKRSSLDCVSGSAHNGFSGTRIVRLRQADAALSSSQRELQVWLTIQAEAGDGKHVFIAPYRRPG